VQSYGSGKSPAIAHGSYGGLVNQLRQMNFLKAFIFPITFEPDQFPDPVQKCGCVVPSRERCTGAKTGSPYRGALNHPRGLPNAGVGGKREMHKMLCRNHFVGQERTSLYSNVNPAPFTKTLT